MKKKEATDRIIELGKKRQKSQNNLVYGYYSGMIKILYEQIKFKS